MSRRSLSTNVWNPKFKRPKLDILITTQNDPDPPLPNRQRSNDGGDWGDDSDDEILLLASQACEKAETDVTSQPSFNIDPCRTSTQVRPTGSVSYSSRVEKSTASLASSSSKQSSSSSLKLYYNESKSSDAVLENKSTEKNIKHYQNKNRNANFVVNTNDNVEVVTPSISHMASNGHMQNLLKELHGLKIQNEKLKTEQESFMEKCSTKEGEVSILRMQLKNMQSQMSILKVEKLKHQEKTQMEWAEKLQRANTEINSIKSQLDFKNLEIVNIKEKCKRLETSKIKFVEPAPSTVSEAMKWTSFSQKFNSSSVKAEPVTRQYVTTKEMSSQMEQINKPFTLSSRSSISYPMKDVIEKSFFHHSMPENPVIFNSNKHLKLVEHSDFSHIRKRMLKEFNGREIKNKKEVIKLDCIYEDLNVLMRLSKTELIYERYAHNVIRIVFISNQLFLKLHNQLKEMSMKVSLLTLREMDERYLEFASKKNNLMIDCSLFDGRCWHENEQAIDARRALAVVTVLCDNFKPLVDIISQPSKWIMNTLPEMVNFLQTIRSCCKYTVEDKPQDVDILSILGDICKIIGKIGCSHLYVGILCSLCRFLSSCIKNVSDLNTICLKVYRAMREILLLRPHARVVADVMDMLALLMHNDEFLRMMCDNSEKGNIKLDYSEGVAMYSKDTCSIQLLCNNIEVWTTHFVDMEHMETMFSITKNLIETCHCASQRNIKWTKYTPQHICLCPIKINRCICVCLHRCAYLYCEFVNCLKDKNLLKKFNSTIRAGIVLLNFHILNDIEYILQLGEYEEHYQMFVSICNKFVDQLELHDMHKEALDGLSESFMPALENLENPSAETVALWEKCFENFSVYD